MFDCYSASEQQIPAEYHTGGVFMKFKLKDPGSAITHGIAMLLAVAGATPLIVKAARSADILHVFAVSVFILTMILLYLASTLYHSVNSTAKVNRRLKKWIT